MPNDAERSVIGRHRLFTGADSAFSIRTSTLTLACAAAFILLCTLNSAGYRYGASDQALYTPAVLRHLDPALFPRDAPLIDTQARLMLNDEVVAALSRVTGLSLQPLYFLLYVATLALLLTAGLRLGGRMYRTRGACLALAAAMTLRHAISHTGTNSLEGYFHPRQVAFALGLLAAALFLERRDRLVIACLAGMAVAHTTTFVWFAIWLIGAAWAGRPDARRVLALGTAAVALVALWMLWRGPFAGRLHRIDPAWMGVISGKDYLFPLSWPLDAWATNLVTIPIILVAWRSRVRSGLAVEGEGALVAGAMMLAVLFLCWLPFNAARLALAVQMQASRLFWILDAFATVYLVWAIAEGTARAPSLARRGIAAAALVTLLSAARGGYICFVQFPDRKIVSIDVQHDDWRDAMAWARTTDARSGWLADPQHASLYGASLRAIGERDVLLEDAKDAALAMYDRNIAMRVADRRAALAEHPWDTAGGARALARRYDLDYLVTSAPVALPVAFRAGSLTIYRLR